MACDSNRGKFLRFLAQRHPGLNVGEAERVYQAAKGSFSAQQRTPESDRIAAAKATLLAMRIRQAGLKPPVHGKIGFGAGRGFARPSTIYALAALADHLDRLGAGIISGSLLYPPEKAKPPKLPAELYRGSTGAVQARLRERAEIMAQTYPGVRFSVVSSNPLGVKQGKERGIPGVGLPRAIYDSQVAEVSDPDTVEKVIAAYKKYLQSGGYTTFTTLKYTSVLPFQVIFGVVKYLKRCRPEKVRFTVDRAGNGTAVSLLGLRCSRCGRYHTGEGAHECFTGQPGSERMSREMFRSQAEQAGWGGDEVDAAMLLMDARARAWAAEHNRSAEEWYPEHLAGVTAGQHGLDGAIGETLFQLAYGGIPTQRPWELRYEQLVRDIDVYQDYRASYEAADGSLVGSSRRMPAQPHGLAVGAWVVDDEVSGIYGHEIGQVQMLDPNDPTLRTKEKAVERNEEGRGDDADRYSQWLREGKEPPPIRVIEHADGGFVIIDGHRRYHAAKRAGQRVLALVFPGMESNSLKGQKTVGLTYEVALLDAYLRGDPVDIHEVRRVVSDVQAGLYGGELPARYPDLFSLMPIQIAPIAGEREVGLPRGAVQFLADGRAVIHALRSPDASTLCHELAHIFRRDLTRADNAVIEEWIRGEYGVDIHIGQDGRFVDDGLYRDPEGRVVDVGGEATPVWAEERFARGFERYIYEGSAPAKGLKAVFGRFSAWLGGIYAGARQRDIDVRLNGEMRSLFDRILGGQPGNGQTDGGQPDQERAGVRSGDERRKMRP